jgi:hypothetical protein
MSAQVTFSPPIERLRRGQVPGSYVEMQPVEVRACGSQGAAYLVDLVWGRYAGRFADAGIAVPASLVLAEKSNNFIGTPHRATSLGPDYTAARPEPKLHSLSTHIGSACAKQFKTFADLSEKLNMDLTDLMRQCNGKAPT